MSNHSNLLAKEGPELSQLDWPCKIDIKKNMERTIQTKPIPMTNGDTQCWAFVLDLGNNGIRSPKNGRAVPNHHLQSMPWLKFSVLECCTNQGNSGR